MGSESHENLEDALDSALAGLLDAVFESMSCGILPKSWQTDPLVLAYIEATDGGTAQRIRDKAFVITKQVIGEIIEIAARRVVSAELARRSE